MVATKREKARTNQAGAKIRPMAGPSSSLPDSKIKQARKLVGLLRTWQEIERQWVDTELALDNQKEQLQAACQENEEFISLCKKSIGDEKAKGVLYQLKLKLYSAIDKTTELQQAVLTELEAHQKKFYQLRLEIEKSLSELTSNPGNVAKGQSVYFTWDEVIRWTVELHTRLCISIEAKKGKLPFDQPTLLERVLERLDCLNYIA